MTDGDWAFQFDNWDSKSAHAKEQRSFNDDVILYLMASFPRSDCSLQFRTIGGSLAEMCMPCARIIRPSQ